MRATANTPESLLPPDLFARGLGLNQILAIALAYRKPVAIAALSAMLLAGLFSKFVLSKSYDASATVLVDYEVNAPDSNREFPSTLAASYMTTQLAFIGSAPVLGPVVDQLGWASDAEKTSGYSGPADGLREHLMWKVLSKNLSINNPPESRFIYISYRAPSPAEAARVANLVAERYVSEQARRQREPAQQRAAEYLKSVDELKLRLDKAQKAVAEFRQKTGLVDLKGSNQLEEERLRDMSSALLIAEAEGKNASIRSSQVARLRSNSGDADVEFATSPGVVRIKDDLLTAETRFSELRKTLGPRHPDYVAAAAQVQELQARLQREVSGFASGVVQNAQAASGQSAGLVQGLKARIEAERKALLTIREQQDEGAQLISELEAAEKVYNLALDNYGQIIRSAETSYSSVSLVAPATPPARHTKPQSSVNALLGLVGGGICALLVAFLWEMLRNRRVRCVEDFEQEFGEPPLVVIGEGR